MQFLTIHVNGEEMDDNDFDEFLQEAYLLDEDDGLLINNSEMVILVKWICLFRAHWKGTFNITDDLLCLLLKFLYVLFQSYVWKCGRVRVVKIWL